MDTEYEKLIEVLKSGGVAVIPTDTLYGIVCRAEDQSAVERVYEIRKRRPDKPCIVLIGDIKELEKFSVYPSEAQKEIVNKYWNIDVSNEIKSEPVSIVFDCNDEKFSYLHRGTNTLAFRLPNNAKLREVLLQNGPLIAPSANIEGLPPSESIEDAKKYFGDKVDLYVDAGRVTSKASKVIRLNTDGTEAVLRA